MKFLISIKLITSFVLVISTNCIAQVDKSSIKMEAGKGIQFTSADSSFTIAIGGRIQSVFEARRDITNETTGADFLLRRCRLNIKGNAFNPKFSYRIQLGFAHGDIASANSSVQNNLILRDAMLFYDASKWLRIGFGQTKLPGNRQRQVSSANLQLVERSISNNNFTLDRDKGVWLYTNFNINKTVLKSTIAISSGEGRIVSDKNGKLCYSARVEFLPFGDFSKKGDYTEADIEREIKPKLSIAGVYSFNEAATRTMGQLGDYLYNAEIANIQYYGVDLMFKYKGFSIESELYNRNSNEGIITNINNTTQQNYIVAGNTFMIQSGYFITRKNEIAARYAQITPENSVASIMNMQKEYVLGFSHYFNKHSLKLQSDLTYLENGTNKNLIYRLSCVVTF
ncbi:MAG: FmdC precursor [Saprospiraceae bacterium]|nr:FmdC precursor [Saprospiraceae bacterium]